MAFNPNYPDCKRVKNRMVMECKLIKVPQKRRKRDTSEADEVEGLADKRYM
jgi:hypothetical protein